MNMTTDYLKLPFVCYKVNIENAGKFLSAGNKVVPFEGALAFALCTGGTLEVTKQGLHYTLNKRDTMIVQPMETAIVENISSDFTCLAVVAGYDFFIEVMDGVLDIPTQIRLGQHPFVRLTEAQYEMIVPLMLTLLERIEAENRSGLTVDQHNLLRRLIISMAESVAYEILRIEIENLDSSIEEQQITQKDHVVHQYILMVYQQFAEHRDVAYYAEQLHLSPHYLSTLVKERTDINASVWIRERVLGEAKRLLDNTLLSVKEIAARLNFPNQSFFGRYFKQYVGVSPAQYKRGNKLNNKKKS